MTTAQLTHGESDHGVEPRLLLFRTSLKEWLVLTACLGLAFTALNNAGPTTLWIIERSCWTALGAVVATACLKRGQWIGFAVGVTVVAGLYIVLSEFGNLTAITDPFLRSAMQYFEEGPEITTEYYTTQFYSTDGLLLPDSYLAAPQTDPLNEFTEFMQVGHALIGIALTLLGGRIGSSWAGGRSESQLRRKPAVARANAQTEPTQEEIQTDSRRRGVYDVRTAKIS